MPFEGAGEPITTRPFNLGRFCKTSVTRFKAGDTLFGAIRPYFHKVGIAPIDGVTNTSIFVVRPHREMDWPFVALLLSFVLGVAFVNEELFTKNWSRATPVYILKGGPALKSASP
jgi:hypothetical protein